MMSIDEAIAHEREVAEIQRKDNDNCEYKAEYGCKGCAYYYSKPCIECVEEHEQLAEWLEELKVYQQHEIICNKGYNAGYNKGYNAGYNKAIDDFVKLVHKHDWNIRNINENSFIYGAIDTLAEQLKAGEQNE